MTRQKLKYVVGALVLGSNVLTLHAQMAQDPLLSRTAAVEPNIVFMFDDSGSMNSTAIYQYGGGTGYQGQQGPNDDAECISGSGCVWIQPPTTFHGLSPDVNLLYYDPRVQYKRRINADGTYMAAGSTSGISSFKVYFYKPFVTTTYSVASVTVLNGGAGYPAAVTATFPAPPAGGVRATATVQIGTSQGVNGVTINNGGAGYTNSPNPTVAFGAPPTGGTQATGTVQTSAASGVTGVTLNSGTFPNNACSATVTAPQNVKGTTAVITPTRQSGTGNRIIQSFTINNPGSGYTAAPTVTVTCGSQSRPFVTSIGTVGRWVTGIVITNPGAGYSTMPSVTVSGTVGGGFSGTATPITTNRIATVTVTNSGSGYSAPPAISLGGVGTNTSAQLQVNTTANTVGGVNQRWDGSGNPTVAAVTTLASYFSPSYTPDAGSAMFAGATVVPYPVNASSATASYPKFRNRSDCAGVVCTWLEEQQNYANWKQYHSTRVEMSKTGIGLAFQPLNPTFRLGWGTINSINNNSALDAGVRYYNSTVQSSFLTWLYGRTSSPTNTTPNRIALDKVGTYFTRKDDNGPWGNTPNGNGALSNGSSNTSHAACRRSYAMLMTDGYYNDSITIVDQDSVTGTTITQPSNYTYQPVGPYSDSLAGTRVANTFADVAMKYYLTDLRSDIANNVRSVPGDEAFWQHLNFYAIGLGVRGTLNYEDPAVLKSLTGTATGTPPRTRSWPTPTTNDPRAIDDMWHATVNARGKMLNAGTSDELNDAITKMMSDIGGKEGSQSGVAVSTASLTRDTKKYTPSYTPVTWNGNVTAFDLDATTANQSGVAWEVEKLVSTDTTTGAKVYQSLMPDDSLRNIYVGTGSSSTPKAVTFTFAGMPATLRSQMNGTVNQNLIDYLRGDATNEDVSASSTNPSAIYRPRLTRLGDIVNSTPVFVKDTIALDYSLLPTTIAPTPTWATYKTAKQARTEGVIFVGANDGMLHAFRDGTYDAAGTPVNPGGVEVFAYVPNALLPTLNQLADKTYVHRYYVDGPNTEVDAYLTGRGGWRNVVLGSTGAGNGGSGTTGTSSPRTGVYAIDTTQLNTAVSGMTAANVMWEASSADTTNFAELGYVLTDIQAGVTVNGDWVAVFGNGYDSKSCQARLFVVNLETGAKIRELNTTYGNCTTQKNGLGGVRLVRDDKNRVMGVYAGDLQGNMWKFDLSGAPASWKVDLGGTPLYAAGPNQPITAPPTFLKLPIIGTTAPAPGYMVVFGTGKFYEVPDITSVTQQTLYGIWDPVTTFGVTPPTGTTLSARTLLVQQTISAAQTGVDGNTYYSVSRNAVDYTATIPKRGWYIDFPNTGQRLVYPLDLLADRFAVADTISPANVSLDPCNNEQGGAGFLYVVDAVNGAGPDEPILDTNGDGSVDSNDLVVSGYAGKADGRNVTLSVEKNDEEQKFAEISAEAGAKIFKISCRLTGTCKSSGATVRRQWRQLFLR